MDLFAVVDQVIELLRSRGRVSYRALRVQFHRLESQRPNSPTHELSRMRLRPNAVSSPYCSVTWWTRRC
jgi:hypothetical protein